MPFAVLEHAFLFLISVSGACAAGKLSYQAHVKCDRTDASSWDMHITTCDVLVLELATSYCEHFNFYQHDDRIMGVFKL